MKLRFQSTDPNNTRIEDSAKKCAETAKYGGANDLLQNATKSKLADTTRLCTSNNQK